MSWFVMQETSKNVIFVDCNKPLLIIGKVKKYKTIRVYTHTLISIDQFSTKYYELYVQFSKHMEIPVLT